MSLLASLQTALNNYSSYANSQAVKHQILRPAELLVPGNSNTPLLWINKRRGESSGHDERPYRQFVREHFLVNNIPTP